MKNLKEISKELIEILKTNNPYFSEDDGFQFYCALSGYYNEEYYLVNLYNFNSENFIILPKINDNPELILEFIKKIEPEAEVTYYAKIVTYKEIMK